MGPLYTFQTVPYFVLGREEGKNCWEWHISSVCISLCLRSKNPKLTAELTAKAIKKCWKCQLIFVLQIGQFLLNLCSCSSRNGNRLYFLIFLVSHGIPIKVRSIMLPLFSYSCLCLTEQGNIKLWERNGSFLCKIECCPVQRTLLPPWCGSPTTFYIVSNIRMSNTLLFLLNPELEGLLITGFFFSTMGYMRHWISL